MARDAAKKRSTGATRASSAKPARSSRPWSWFFSGIGCGVVLSVTAYFVLFAPAANQPQQNASIKPKPTAPAKPSTETQFDFYTLLPEREVVVPKGTPPASENSAQESVRYLLQAGSFRRSEDADRLRAKLLLLGLEATTQPVTSSGSTWHRVLVGPFESRSNMSAARATLIHEGIDTLLLKRSAADT